LRVFMVLLTQATHFFGSDIFVVDLRHLLDYMLLDPTRQPKPPGPH